MKISLESFAKLQDAVLEARKEVSFTLESYTEQGLSQKRYRWDLLWYATSKILEPNWVCDVLYREEELSDVHIDSALRKITETK